MVKSEERALALLIDANPYPDVDHGHESTIDGAVFATSLAGRNVERARMVDSMLEGPAKERRRRSWLVAAVAALVIGGAALLALQTSGEKGPVVATTEASPSVPTSAPPPSLPTTLALTEASSWDALPVFTGGKEGEFRTDVFFVPVKFTVPSGTWWPKGEEFEDFADLTTEFSAPPNPYPVGISFMDWGAGDIAATVEAITGVPGADYSEPVPALVGGAEGMKVTATSVVDSLLYHDSPDNGGCVTRWCEGMLRIGKGDTVDFYVLDVAGKTVTVAVGDEEGGDFRTQAQAVLDSIVWRDLG